MNQFAGSQVAGSQVAGTQVVGSQLVGEHNDKGDPLIAVDAMHTLENGQEV